MDTFIEFKTVMAPRVQVPGVLLKCGQHNIGGEKDSEPFERLFLEHAVLEFTQDVLFERSNPLFERAVELLVQQPRKGSPTGNSGRSWGFWIFGEPPNMVEEEEMCDPEPKGVAHEFRLDTQSEPHIGFTKAGKFTRTELFAQEYL